MTQVFLVNPTGGPGSFPDPGNWTPEDNTIEVISSGGNGGTAPTGGGCTQPPCIVYESPNTGKPHPWTKEELILRLPTDPNHPQVGSVIGSGAGGGGGAYGKGVNLTPTFPVPYYLQPSIFSSGSMFYYTTWGSSVNHYYEPPQTEGWVWAASGKGGVDYGTGGPKGWPNGRAGGNGGLGGGANTNGGGGGGAAGPNGIGSNGAASSMGGMGGIADGGNVPGGIVGGNGNSSTYWDATHGVGSGAGGGTSASPSGGLAANYGGAAGGCYGIAGTTGLVGGHSIIVITYNTHKPSNNAIIMA